MRPQHRDGVLQAAATRTCMAIATAQQPAGRRVSDHLCSVPEGSAADGRGRAGSRRQQQRRPELRQHHAGADHHRHACLGVRVTVPPCTRSAALHH